jgi:DNA processing protein
MLGVQSLGPVVPCRTAEEPAPLASGGREAAAGSRAAVTPWWHPGGGEAVGAARTDAPPPPTGVQSERDAWVALLSVQGLGPVSFGALLGAFGSARGVLLAASGPGGPDRLVQALADAAADTAEGLDVMPAVSVFDACAALVAGDAETPNGQRPPRRRPVIGAELAARICEVAARGSSAVEQVRALGLTVVTLEEPAYPDRLRLVDMPPPLLFVHGSVVALSAGNAVAVVGTRRPTDKGRLIAGWIGSALARAGAAVISGLAFGIDGAAHAAVVAEGGTTVAVLGGGHARLFPAAHERLADAIVEAGGAVVSELAPETAPTRGTFPRRNRLVSGLSDATVVVEAGRRSGALITAGWALEQGRDCYLVPGPFDAPTSAGCHAFLRNFPGQARVVAGIEELIEDIGLDAAGSTVAATPASPGRDGRLGSGPSSSPPGAGRAAVLAALGPVELALAEQLIRGPATADQLSQRTSLAAASVLSALTLLELRGLARCAYGRYSPSGALASWSGSGSMGGG